jgi:hypothetical protein
VTRKRKKKRKCEKQVRFMDFFSLLNFPRGFTFVFQKTLQENWYSDTVWILSFSLSIGPFWST